MYCDLGTPFSPGLINIGSVGQPRDGNPQLCFVIYDTETTGVDPAFDQIL